MSIIIFIIALGVLIFVHELGHFLVAKISGVKVYEFGIGFPPRLFSFKPKKSETRYSINLLPFGGFVKMLGENVGEVKEEELNSKRSLLKKPKWIQVLVLFAGVFFNLIFAWVLISGGLMSGMPVAVSEDNMDTVLNPRLLVLDILPESPAELAGLKPGDEILFTESGDKHIQGDNLSVSNFQDIISKSGGEKISLMYKRGEERESIIIESDMGVVENTYAIGVSISMVGEMELPFFSALAEGAKSSWFLLRDTTVGIFTFFYKAITGQADLSKVAGPVGIISIGSEATKAGFGNLLFFMAFISINLVILNLLPFPALDGGRLLFLFIEKIKGSPINPKIAGVLNLIGLGILLILMLIVTFNDILRFF